jgi:hypothetical protein
VFSARWVSGVSVCFFEFVKTVIFLGQMANNKIHTETRYVQWTTGQGRRERVLAPVKNFFRGPPGKGGPAKELYPKLERLTLSCRVTWATSERFNLYSRQITIPNTEKYKNICIMNGTRAPFRTAGPRQFVTASSTPHRPSRRYSYWQSKESKKYFKKCKKLTIH